MVLHTGSHAAPHALVGQRIDTVTLWTQGSEVDVAARLRVLSGEDVVPHGLFVEVGILGGGLHIGHSRAVEEHLRKLQHVVGIARLRAVGLVDVTVAVGTCQKVLVDGVAANADSAVLRHVLPEVFGSDLVACGCCILLVDTFETNVFRYLGIGMLAIEEAGVQYLHAVEHGFVREFLGGRQVLLVAKQLVGIKQRLVHTAVLAVEKVLEIRIRNLSNEVDAPVAEFAKHLTGLMAAAVDVGVAQSGQDLMLAVEGHPAPVAANLGEVAAVEGAPRVIDGLSADETIESLGVVVVLVLTVLHHLKHIVHAFLQ